MTKFRLFACCMLTKGTQRSIICDLQRGDIYFITEALFEILTLYKNQDIKAIKKKYKNQHDEVIDEYFDFLIRNELGFFTNEINRFPDINLEWNFAGIVSNAIIEIDDIEIDSIFKIITQLNDIGCKYIELRCYKSNISTEILESIFCKFDTSKIRSIDVIFPFNLTLTKEFLEILLLKYQRINKIVLHSADKFTSYENPQIFITPQVIDSKKCCGQISSDYFSINLSTFTESQKHNTCLNRKISIDAEGNIKNCPSMTKSYGNIRDTTLREAIEKQGFKDVWYIHKDQIEVCKDCEFRHICTDCRAYIQDPNNIYSKPAKCSYNPYTATWGDDNPTNNPLHGK